MGAQYKTRALWTRSYTQYKTNHYLCKHTRQITAIISSTDVYDNTKDFQTGIIFYSPNVSLKFLFKTSKIVCRCIHTRKMKVCKKISAEKRCAVNGQVRCLDSTHRCDSYRKSSSIHATWSCSPPAVWSSGSSSRMERGPWGGLPPAGGTGGLDLPPYLRVQEKMSFNRLKALSQITCFWFIRVEQWQVKPETEWLKAISTESFRTFYIKKNKS